MVNIRVTPETLETQGNDLIGYAGDLSDILASIDSKITEISDEGGMDEYFYMYTTMKQDVDRFTELVNNIGKATVLGAQTVQEYYSIVDEEKLALFK